MSESDQKWLQNAPKKSKIKLDTETYNYWAPLTRPVEDLEQINSVKRKHVTFAEEVVIEPTVSVSNTTLKWKRKIANRKERKQVKQQLRSGDWEAMETGIMDSGASSSCGGPNNALIRTGEASSKTYKVPTGQIVSASERAILAHNLRDPAREVQIVPAMSETLLSVGQFADAGYVTVFDNQSVKIFDGSIELTKDAVI